MLNTPVVTYVPDFETVLTRRCQYGCGYCNFPRTPSSPPPARKMLRKLVQAAMRLGANQMTFSAGEGIDSLTEIQSVSRYYGYANWWAYLRAACELVLNERGPRPLAPVLEVGAIPASEIKATREVVAVVRLMLDSGDEKLLTGPVHGLAPHKAPAQRLAALEELGRWGVPVTTGIQVGLGESPETWEKTAKVVSGLYARHGHIQNFVIRPFEPHAFTPLALYSPPPDPVILRAVRTVREHLDRRVRLTVEAHSRPHLAVALLKAGTTDLGAFRLGGNSGYNCDATAAVDLMRTALGAYGVQLCERTAVLEDFAHHHDFPTTVKRTLELQHSNGSDSQDRAACG